VYTSEVSRKLSTWRLRCVPNIEMAED